ncbi:sugar phosphate isomerase/epimerase family protein [Paenibacillus piri]|nr:sugar phosphate isomerase/epimerase [Paenibacillus piri]
MDIKFAAMTLTWNNPSHDQFPQWLKEVKEAGYDGITGFAHNHAFEYFLEHPKELYDLLDHFGLGLSSLDVTYQENLDYYKKVSEFLAYNRCPNMAYIDPKGLPKEFSKLGERMNEVGKISLQYGVRTLYHNHTRGIGETFAEVERVHEHVDPDKVFVMLDLGHATKDFTDLPVKERAIHFVSKYWSKIKFMEFKDWNETTDLNTPLGEGHCDYAAVFQLIKEKGYHGWITVEQNGNDGLSRGRQPFECAKASREFIQQGLGI